jgi:hypothetical protein
MEITYRCGFLTIKSVTTQKRVRFVIMDNLIYKLYHIRHHTSVTHSTNSLSAVSIHCLLVHRITSILHSQIFGSFSLSFIFCNLSYTQNIYSSLCIGVPSRSDASTQHHVQPTSQEFPIPLRLPTSILCHIISPPPRLQYRFHSPVFFSPIHKYEQHAFLAMSGRRSPHLLSAYMYSGRPRN